MHDIHIRIIHVFEYINTYAHDFWERLPQPAFPERHKPKPLTQPHARRAQHFQLPVVVFVQEKDRHCSGHQHLCGCVLITSIGVLRDFSLGGLVRCRYVNGCFWRLFTDKKIARNIYWHNDVVISSDVLGDLNRCFGRLFCQYLSERKFDTAVSTTTFVCV